MPEPRAMGNVAKRTLLDLLDGLEGDARLLVEAFADLSDGDDDTSKAMAAIVQLLANNGTEAGVINHLLRDDLQRAEDSAQRLAAGAKKLVNQWTK